MLSRISRSATSKNLNVNSEDSFNRLAFAVDFERLIKFMSFLFYSINPFTLVSLDSVLEDWQQPCTQEGIGLNKNVITEFKRRIKEAGLAGTAAHLDLRNGLLNARQVMLISCDALDRKICKTIAHFLRFILLFAYMSK